MSDEGAPLDIETAGGRVIVAFADRAAASGSAAIEGALAMTRRDGPIGEIEGVIVAEAGRLGLTALVSGTRHPTTILVSSRGPTPQPRPSRQEPASIRGDHDRRGIPDPKG